MKTADKVIVATRILPTIARLLPGFLCEVCAAFSPKAIKAGYAEELVKVRAVKAAAADLKGDGTK